MPIPRSRYMADNNPTKTETDAPATVDSGGSGVGSFSNVNELAELVIAPREDLLTEIARLGKSTESFDQRVGAEIRAIEQEEDEDKPEDTDDLEAEDGFSEAPLIRLVNALIHQAADDGASDVHVE